MNANMSAILIWI